MTIDNSLELFEDNFTVINTHGHYTEEEESQAMKTAVDTMRKYQKIKEIYDNWNVDFGVETHRAMSKIGEVLNDGNDNN